MKVRFVTAFAAAVVSLMSVPLVAHHTVRPAANGRPFGLLTQALLPDGTKLGDATTGGRGTP